MFLLFYAEQRSSSSPHLFTVYLLFSPELCSIVCGERVALASPSSESSSSSSSNSHNSSRRTDYALWHCLYQPLPICKSAQRKREQTPDLCDDDDKDIFLRKKRKTGGGTQGRGSYRRRAVHKKDTVGMTIKISLYAVCGDCWFFTHKTRRNSGENDAGYH